MLYEPSTLASLTGLLATTLREEYDIDPAPLFSRAGLPLIPEGSPQQRYPLSTMRELWRLSREASGDETIGLKTGTYAKPPLFYAFGYSWMASSTLLGAMQRLVRYYRLMSTASVVVELTELEDSYALSATFPEESKSPPKEGIDCGMTALLTLCDIVAEKEIRPIRIKLTCPASVHPDAYRQALRAPIEFDAPVGMFYFSKEVLLEPLPHGAADIARATDKIAEHYIETLDPHNRITAIGQNGPATRFQTPQPQCQQFATPVGGRGTYIQGSAGQHSSESCGGLPRGRRAFAGTNRLYAGIFRSE
jgi:hypothetical protein